MRAKREARGFLVNLLLFSLVTVLCLSLAELFVRTWRPKYYLTSSPGAMLEVGSLIRLRPGYRGRLTRIGDYDTSIAVNSLGLRGPETTVRKPPGTFRILAVGDSFTFGFGVEAEESFVALLQEKLRDQGLAVESLNAGTPGVGVTDEFAWLKRYGLDMEPDLVVLGVCLANDLLDADMPATKFPHWKTPHWIYRKSHLFRLLARSVPARLKTSLGLTDAILGTYDLSYGKFYMREMVIRYDDASPQAQASKRLNRAALDGFARVRSERGVPVVALLIPGPFHLQDEIWRNMLADLDMDPAVYRRTVPWEFFRSELDERSIPTLDLSERTLAALEKGDKIFLADGHWSPPGHRMVADALTSFLLDHGLVGQPAAVKDGAGR